MINYIGTRMRKLEKKICGTQAAPASSEAISCTRLSGGHLESIVLVNWHLMLQALLNISEIYARVTLVSLNYAPCIKIMLLNF